MVDDCGMVGSTDSPMTLPGHQLPPYFSTGSGPSPQGSKVSAGSAEWGREFLRHERTGAAEGRVSEGPYFAGVQSPIASRYEDLRSRLAERARGSEESIRALSLSAVSFASSAPLVRTPLRFASRAFRGRPTGLVSRNCAPRRRRAKLIHQRGQTQVIGQPVSVACGIRHPLIKQRTTPPTYHTESTPPIRPYSAGRARLIHRGSSGHDSLRRENGYRELVSQLHERLHAQSQELEQASESCMLQHTTPRRILYSTSHSMFCIKCSVRSPKSPAKHALQHNMQKPYRMLYCTCHRSFDPSSH